MVFLKSPSEIEKMTASGRVLGKVLEAIGHAVRPGVSTADLDKIAREMIKKAGATPSFLGYGHPPFPAAICASIDDEIVHGIPSEKRRLQEGDIISIDAGVYLDGYHADAARTFPVGSISPEKSALVSTARQCFWKAMAIARAGKRIGDLSAAIQKQAESHGYGVVRELTGHGIGRALHEEPDVPNFGRPGHGLRLKAGMAIAIEPMINLGTRRVRMLNDGWTIVTADGQPSAHYENTLIITDREPLILTLMPGEHPYDGS